MFAEQHGRLMGTRVHLAVAEAHGPLLTSAWRFLEELDQRWSRFRPGSDISQINRANGEWTTVASATASLLSLSIEGWRATDGRFDPTVGAAMVANGYGQTFTAGPTPVSPSVPAPGAGVIELDGRSVRVPQGTALDVGGIGKGQAADLVVAHLLEAGAEGAVASLGGDVRAGGTPPDHTPWRLHLPDGEPFITLRDGAVCMSTTTGRRWSTPACTHHHLVDPRTGTPTANGLRSVAVAADTAAGAEIVTKSLFVLGAERAPAELASLGLPGRLWLADGRVIDLGRARAVA